MSVMPLEQAKEILNAIPSTKVTNANIRGGLEYIKTDVEVREDGLRRVQLDGFFTANKLEALAVWMRDRYTVDEA